MSDFFPISSCNDDKNHRHGCCALIVIILMYTLMVLFKNTIDIKKSFEIMTQVLDRVRLINHHLRLIIEQVFVGIPIISLVLRPLS